MARKGSLPPRYLIEMELAGVRSSLSACPRRRDSHEPEAPLPLQALNRMGTKGKADTERSQRIYPRYRFQENYYFMASDRATSSRDSRYWGLLPDAYIVGVATLIWKSVGTETGKVRCKRVMKTIE